MDFIFPLLEQMGKQNLHLMSFPNIEVHDYRSFTQFWARLIKQGKLVRERISKTAQIKIKEHLI